MLSRVAENIYWLARYLERAEDTARLLSVTSNLLLDLPRSTKLGWEEIIAITGNDELFDEHYENRDEASVLNFMCGDTRYSGSILSSLAAARENLRTTRDVIPREIWEEVNQLYLSVKEQVESGITPRRRDAFLSRVIRSCQTVNGIIEGTLSYTQARTFLMLGRQLERADMITRIIDVRSANLLPRNADDLKPFENLQWMSVLKSLSGYQMYRQHVRLRVRGPDVLSFLLQDMRYPRAVACSLERFSFALKNLKNHDEALEAVELCRQRIAGADIIKLAAEPDLLHAFVDEIQLDFTAVHDAVNRSWFERGERSTQAQAQSA
ncbi:MAG: alpha-E domain-containing protein [Gammaproteobacteria bacterium]|nr:alpha-E domain-containing protein [Gammaproteobacteria bacterium]